MDSGSPAKEGHTPAKGSAATEDQRMVEGCVEGRRSAQRELYERYVDRVYAIVLKMTGNRDEAFDLSQDVFLRVFEKIEGFRGDSALSTWIHRVTVNTALHHLRGVQRGRAAADQVRDRTSPSVDSSNPDLSIDLDAVLAGLPDLERTILLLRYQQELSYAEIAKILEIPMGTVGSRLNRAREQLRGRLDGYSDDGVAPRTPEAAPEEGKMGRRPDRHRKSVVREDPEGLRDLT